MINFALKIDNQHFLLNLARCESFQYFQPDETICAINEAIYMIRKKLGAGSFGAAYMANRMKL